MIPSRSGDVLPSEVEARTEAAGVAIVIMVAVFAVAFLFSADTLVQPWLRGQASSSGVWVYLVASLLGAVLAALVYGRGGGAIACGKLVKSDRYAYHFRVCAHRICFFGQPQDSLIGHPGDWVVSQGREVGA